jgi:hypothetical protein
MHELFFQSFSKKVPLTEGAIARYLKLTDSTSNGYSIKVKNYPYKGFT